jgi:hypothetical protein
MLISILSFSLAAATLVAAAPLVPEPPSPVPITARLLTALSSYHSKAGDEVEAVISAPVCFDGVPLETDSRLLGAVERVHAVGWGVAHETASMQFRLQQLWLPDGRNYPIEARLTAIDNARERVDRHGKIHGIRATDTLSSRFSSHLFFAAHAHPALIIPSLAVESWLFRFPEPEFEYGAGTELFLEVTFPEGLGHVAACAEETPLPEDESAWDGLVADVPAWSFSKRQPQPMDPVNLVFLGSLEGLERAFQAAGWTGSKPNSLRTGVEAVRAIAEDRGYADAPMRTLLLDGATPDLRIQRSLNTFDKRDHMRIWRRDATWQGRTVWAAAATQDLAATFSRRPFGFTHRIESDVDIERDKVARELEFTGCVDSVVRVHRPESIPAEEFRKGLETDARVAVILLNSCEHPREVAMSGAVPGQADAEADPPPPLTRVIRRFTLTARNHFLRDNMIWRTGDAVRIAWHTVHEWEVEKKHRALRVEARGQDTLKHVTENLGGKTAEEIK